MAIKFTTTSDIGSQTVKILVYGKSGIGKTTLSKTAEDVLIISSEQRLLSLKDENIPVILIESHEDLEEAHKFVTSHPKAARFKAIALDSISDIAETILADFKENPQDGNKDARAAYGRLADVLLPIIKKFRNIPDKHVYFIAKAKRVEDEYTGIATWAPAMPGQQLGPGLPYLFDFVLPMRMGETKNGKKYRYLQTTADIQWLAKECSGKLNKIEKPDLTNLFTKILGKEIEEKEEVKKAKEEVQEEVKEEKETKETTEEKQEEGQEEGFENHFEE